MLALAEDAALANVYSAYVLSRRSPLPARPGGSAMQFQREAAREQTPAAVPFRCGWTTRDDHSEGPSRYACPDGRTTRSRVSFFMNRFRDSGFIDYSSKSEVVRVRQSLMDFYTQKIASTASTAAQVTRIRCVVQQCRSHTRAMWSRQLQASVELNQLSLTCPGVQNHDGSIQARSIANLIH